jgi:hypothetical protein
MGWKKWFKWLILLGAPVSLGLLEIWHPAHIHFDDMLSHVHHGDWWLTLHILQMPLFPLVATAVWLLFRDIDHITAKLSQIALWIFAISYTAFDTIAGISTGILIRYMRSMNITSGESYDRMFELFIALFNVDMPGGAVIINLAVWSWVAAVILAATALYIKGYNRVGVLLIGISGLTFQSHVHPYGPITMAILLAGIICIEFFPNHWTEVQQTENEGVVK